MANKGQMESVVANEAVGNPSRRRGPLCARVGLALAGVLPLALLGTGCGSSRTETVSVAAGQTSTPQATRSQPLSTGRTSTSTGASQAPSRTPSATRHGGGGPAFVQPKGGAQEGVESAVAIVKAHGFTPNDPSQYHSSQTLAVLVGTRTGSGDGHGQQAFFFVDGRYIGTDASAASATVEVLAQGDTEVTLAYPLYRAHDPLCCPSGGQAKVRFQLNNGRLTPLDPIPPDSSASGLSRQ